MSKFNVHYKISLHSQAQEEDEEERRRLKVKLGELRISSAERYILSYR
jgi:hypothetical protein